jgi:hypothetical protein
VHQADHDEDEANQHRGRAAGHQEEIGPIAKHQLRIGFARSGVNRR